MSCLFVPFRAHTPQLDDPPEAALGETLRTCYGPIVLARDAACREDENPSKTDALKWVSSCPTGPQFGNTHCSTVSTNPAATSRAHSSRSCITRRRSARRLTRAVLTGATPISINLMRALEY